jgi:hypothetical protein
MKLSVSSSEVASCVSTSVRSRPDAPGAATTADTSDGASDSGSASPCENIRTTLCALAGAHSQVTASKTRSSGWTEPERMSSARTSRFWGSSSRPSRVLTRNRGFMCACRSGPVLKRPRPLTGGNAIGDYSHRRRQARLRELGSDAFYPTSSIGHAHPKHKKKHGCLDPRDHPRMSR